MTEESLFFLFHLYIHPSNLQESVGGESTHMTFIFVCLMLGGLANLGISVSISIFQSRLQIKLKTQKLISSLQCSFDNHNEALINCVGSVVELVDGLVGTVAYAEICEGGVLEPKTRLL